MISHLKQQKMCMQEYEII